MAASTISWKQRIKAILSGRQRKVICREDLTPSAVLVPVYEKEGELYIVLTKRSEDLEFHKGQISFPGGTHEKRDGDLKNTALREAFEEIGINAGDVEILGCLDDWATLSSHFAVTPFIGALTYPCEFRVNRREVKAVIEAPVSALMDPACFSRYTVEHDGNAQPWCSFRYNEHNITGVTARILQQFLELVSR